MKNIIILFIVFISLLSCNAKDKVSTAEVAKNDKEMKIGKNTLIWCQIEPLPDYSYKGYQIEPYVNFLGENSNKMPIDIGSEWLVLYYRMENKEPIRDLKLCEIQDSTYVSLINGSKYSIPPFYRPSYMDTIAIPVIDNTLTNPETMIFFKALINITPIYPMIY